MKTVYRKKDIFPHSPLDYSNFSQRERRKKIKKTLGKNRLLGIDIALTKVCNLKCKHCYLSAESLSSKAIFALSLDRIKTIIDEAVDLGVHRIQLTGGEPTLHPDYLNIINYIVKEKGRICLLQTNGTTIGKEIDKLLLHPNVIIGISLCSLKPKINDYITGAEGSYNRSMTAIKSLLENGKKFPLLFVNFLLTRKSIKEVGSVIDWAEKNNIRVNFNPVFYTGRAMENLKLLRIPFKEFEEARKMIKKRLKIDIGYHSCGKWLVNCYISAEGILQLCSNVLIPLGDLKKKSLKELWTKQTLDPYRNIKQKLAEPCKSCRFKNCIGCRGRTYAVTGNVLAADPLCVYNKNNILLKPSCVQKRCDI